jgi:hypothetical protein
MTGPTRNANPARLVRCSAGCATMVWLAGALPTAADAGLVCASCTVVVAARVSGGLAGVRSGQVGPATTLSAAAHRADPPGSPVLTGAAPVSCAPTIHTKGQCGGCSDPPTVFVQRPF